MQSTAVGHPHLFPSRDATLRKLLRAIDGTCASGGGRVRLVLGARGEMHGEHMAQPRLGARRMVGVRIKGLGVKVSCALLVGLPSWPFESRMRTCPPDSRRLAWPEESL
jgi:hypothetical protein